MRYPTSDTEAADIARHMHYFLRTYVPAHVSSSSETLRSYRTSLTLYVRWLESEGVTPASLSASHFEAPSVESWLVWLSTERDSSPQTCNVRLSAVRPFLSYVARHDAALAHLEAEAGKVPNRTAPKVHVTGLSRDAVTALAEAPGQATRQGRRDTAIIAALYGTACRVGELLSARASALSLDGDDPFVKVTGKGDKTRVVYVDQRCAEHLLAYVEEFHGPNPPADAYLFWSRNYPAGSHPLSRDAVAKMLRKSAAIANATCPEVPLGLHAHQLRHSRASHWLDEGMNIVQVSMLLGHAKITTTMEYLDVTLDAKATAMGSLPGPKGQEKRWKAASDSLTEFFGLG